MRRRGRQFSIFSLSALDVLAMSTGVFVLLLVMLMPYYHREHDAHAEIDAIRAARAETAAEVRTLEETAMLLRAEAEAADAEAAELEATAAALERQAAADRQAAQQVPQGAEEEERGGDIETPIIEQLDLVFAVDTTASLEPVVREIAFSLRSIVRILESLVPSVRIGVVAYRDHDTGTSLPPVVSLPLTEVDADGPGLRRVVSYIESLAASPVGSATIEEDVLPGLRTAIAMPFRRDARQAIVVIGDAAAHGDEQLETYALARKFAFVDDDLRNVSSLFVTTPSSMRAGNYARGFFVQLAQAGGGAFNEHTGSMIDG